MPPRVPIVAIFVAAYFAVGVGGGGASLAWVMTVDLDWSGIGAAAPAIVDWVRPPETIRLTVAEALALAAASAAVVDAAWRPPRTLLDGTVAAAVAIAGLTGAALQPDWATPALATIVALSLGDAGAALWRRRASARG